MASDNNEIITAKAQRAIARAALAEPGEPLPGKCPTLEQINAWHDQALEEEEASFVKAHVARCDTCFELWRGAATALASGDRSETTVRTKLLNRRPVLALAATVVGLAIAIAFFLQGPYSALPGYDVRINQSATIRGNAAPTSTRSIPLAPGDTFEIVFIPESSVSGPVIARIFVRSGNGWVPLISPPVIDRSRGVLEVSGTVADDVVFPGVQNPAIVVVGRPGKTPTAQMLDDKLGVNTVASTDTWSAWRVVFHLRSGASDR